MQILDFSHATAWLILGAILIVLEIVVLQGIGFLFAGLGAISIGAVITTGIVEKPINQFILFFVFTAIWTALLWKPLKNFIRGKDSGFNDMVGSTAVIFGDDLAKGKTGQVKWSGTIMNCKLDKNYTVEEKILTDTEVVITEISQGILIVRPSSE
jgi:membrane protein implicated in regulation of membrane protease activity